MKQFDDYLFYRNKKAESEPAVPEPTKPDKSPEPDPAPATDAPAINVNLAKRDIQIESYRADAATVLDTCCWKTTGQIARAVNLSADEVLSELERRRETGSVACDGGPILIWKAAIEERLRHHGAIIAIDRRTHEALPLFRAGDADIVKDTADVYLRSEIKLTSQQRADLTTSINRYDCALERERQRTNLTEKQVSDVEQTGRAEPVSGEI